MPLSPSLRIYTWGSLAEIPDLLRHLAAGRVGAALRAAHRCLPLRFAAHNLFLFLLWLPGAPPVLSPTARLLETWMLVSLLVTAVVSLPPLSSLGEGERYFDYSGSIPALALWAIRLPDAPIGWTIASGAVMVFGLALLRFEGRKTSSYPASELARVRESLNRDEVGRLLCIPGPLSPEVAYRTRRPVVYFLGNIPPALVGRIRDIFAESVSQWRDLEGLAQAHGVTHLYCLRKTAPAELDHDPRWTPALETEHFRILRRNALAAGAGAEARPPDGPILLGPGPAMK
jgi:hypothetical protein